MTSFAEQLSTARKAAGMTQEELAYAVHVTRTTISSWERGRTVPGIDSLRLLSQALNVDFINGDQTGQIGETSAAPAFHESLQPAETVFEVPVQPSRVSEKKRLISLLFAAVSILAVCFSLFILPSLQKSKSKNPVPDVDAALLVLEEPELFTREWFQQGNPRYDGEPYVEISTPVTVNTTDQPFPLWVYSVIVEETTGRSFTPERLDSFFFETNVGYEHTWVKAGAIWAASSNNAWRMEGLNPVSDAKGIGYIVYGHDEWGRRMSFRAYLDFTKVNE